MPAEEAKCYRGWSTHRKFYVNYHRCLETTIGEAKGLLLCEDDVVFRDGFVASCCVPWRKWKTSTAW